MRASTRANVVWTGHPLLDVGVAALCVMAEREEPTELTLADLDEVADEIEEAFSLKWLNAYLTCLYPNGAFTNSNVGESKRDAEIQRSLRAHGSPAFPGSASVRCAFSGQPAVAVLDRRHVPLLSGEGVISFTPFGLGGLAAAGWVPLALHAFAFGARRALGRALAVHSDSRELLRYFVQRNVADNRKAALLAKVATEGKYPDVKAPLTLVMSTLAESVREHHQSEQDRQFASLVVYHLTNSGQGADIDIHELDSSVVRFVARALGPKYRRAFDGLVRRMWRRNVVTEGRGKRQTRRYVAPEQLDPETRPNYLFEDLFGLPERSGRFIRTHFLGHRERRWSGETEDPRSYSRLGDQLSELNWDLLSLFLQEVLSMEKKRIEAIRALGDRLASRIADQNDRKLFRSLLSGDYRRFRERLVRSATDEIRAGRNPLVDMDEFLLVFEQAGEVVRVDPRLVMDLLCFRVLEQLHACNHFSARPDALEDLVEQEGTEIGGNKREEYVS